MDIFSKDLYLSILHNPKDILNISISKFFASCQDLYSGCYKNNVLANVFDPNSIPAFLKFDSPIYNKDGEKLSDQLPLSRLWVRNIENFNDDVTKLLFDVCYPSSMRNITISMISKYSGNEGMRNLNDVYDKRYIFTPDIDSDDMCDDQEMIGKLSDPYMDTFETPKRVPFIGVNCKRLYVSVTQDWTNVKISPKAKIRELIIETTDVPKSLYSLPLNLDWVKFRYISIETLSVFKMKSNSISFEKCKINSKVFDELIDFDIHNLQLISVDIDTYDFSKFTNIKELGLIYTLDDPMQLSTIVSPLNLEKLTISGDIVKENKQFINSLKRKGVKIKVEGPII